MRSPRKLINSSLLVLRLACQTQDAGGPWARKALAEAVGPVLFLVRVELQSNYCSKTRADEREMSSGRGPRDKGNCFHTYFWKKIAYYRGAGSTQKGHVTHPNWIGCHQTTAIASPRLFCSPMAHTPASSQQHTETSECDRLNGMQDDDDDDDDAVWMEYINRSSIEDARLIDGWTKITDVTLVYVRSCLSSHRQKLGLSSTY